MAILKVDWNPSLRKLRQFAIGIVVFSALIFGASWRKGHFAGGLRILCAGIVLGTAAFVSEKAGRVIYKGWMSVSFVIGTVITTLVLGIFYYVFLTPVGWVMRLAGRDPLRLKRPAGESYWNSLEPVDDNTYYERLF